MEYCLHFFPRADLRELRFRESGVHQHYPGAELSPGRHRDHEAVVVAAQQATTEPG